MFVRWDLLNILRRSQFTRCTELHRALSDIGLDVSYTSVYRLCSGSVHTVPLETLGALCIVFGKTPSDFIVVNGTPSQSVIADVKLRRKIKPTERPSVKRAPIQAITTADFRLTGPVIPEYRPFKEPDDVDD